MSTRRIAVLVGSLHSQSINRRLARAVEALAPASLQFVDVRIDDLPLYRQDFDPAYPAAAARFKSDIEAADGLLFVTPEFNRSLPGALKNALDIGSRPFGKNSFAGKPGAVIGTSPGAVGTALAQQHLRSVLHYLDVPVLGQPEAYLQFKQDLISEKGEISNESTRKFLRGFVDRYAAWIEQILG